MFYANGLAHRSTGARKKIHGGSGLSGNGDGYGPGCTLFGTFIVGMVPDLSHEMKPPPSLNSMR
jgi:hypothetical protein